MLPDVDLTIAIRRAMFDARKNGANQSGQIERAVAEVINIRPALSQAAALTHVEALLNHINFNDTNNINDVIEYLNSFYHEIIQELHEHGYKKEHFTEFYVEYMSKPSDRNFNSRSSKRDARVHELFKALNYITGVEESMATGATFTALKYAFRVTLNLLGADARIGSRSRLKGKDGASQRPSRPSKHLQCAKRDEELQRKHPEWKARQRAKRIEKEMAKGKNIDDGTPISWSGKPIKWDTIQRVVRKIRGNQG